MMIETSLKCIMDATEKSCNDPYYYMTEEELYLVEVLTMSESVKEARDLCGLSNWTIRCKMKRVADRFGIKDTSSIAIAEIVSSMHEEYLLDNEEEN